MYLGSDESLEQRCMMPYANSSIVDEGALETKQTHVLVKGWFFSIKLIVI